jgi:hypothetical protein
VEALPDNLVHSVKVGAALHAGHAATAVHAVHAVGITLGITQHCLPVEVLCWCRSNRLLRLPFIAGAPSAGLRVSAAAGPPSSCCIGVAICRLAQVLEVPDAGKDELQGAWKQWMQEAGA